MEDRKQKAQELALDEMEKVSGGTTWVKVTMDDNGRTCPWCGQHFSTDQIRDYHDHIMRDCPNLPPAPTIIG